MHAPLFQLREEWGRLRPPHRLLTQLRKSGIPWSVVTSMVYHPIVKVGTYKAHNAPFYYHILLIQNPFEKMLCKLCSFLGLPCQMVPYSSRWLTRGKNFIKRRSCTDRKAKYLVLCRGAFTNTKPKWHDINEKCLSHQRLFYTNLMYVVIYKCQFGYEVFSFIWKVKINQVI